MTVENPTSHHQKDTSKGIFSFLNSLLLLVSRRSDRISAEELNKRLATAKRNAVAATALGKEPKTSDFYHEENVSTPYRKIPGRVDPDLD